VIDLRIAGEGSSAAWGELIQVLVKRRIGVPQFGGDRRQRGAGAHAPGAVENHLGGARRRRWPVAHQRAGPVSPGLPECDPERPIDRDQFRAPATTNCDGSCCRKARSPKSTARRERVRERTDQRITLRTRSMRGLSRDGKLRSGPNLESPQFRSQNAADGISASYRTLRHRPQVP